MLAHTTVVVNRIKTIPALATKTYELTAPRDAQGKLPIAPYVVVQPDDGTDSQMRFTGGRTRRNLRVVLHIAGSSYTNAQTVTELVKPLFITAGGFGIQINVTGEAGKNLRWSAQPTQKDDDVTPPLIFNTVELLWESEPS
jgi:hypothetical protein